MKDRIKKIILSKLKKNEAGDREFLKTPLVTWFLIITASAEFLPTSYGITLTQ